MLFYVDCCHRFWWRFTLILPQIYSFSSVLEFIYADYLSYLHIFGIKCSPTNYGWLKNMLVNFIL